MNNLYGKAIMEPLLYGGFKWMKVNDNTTNTVLSKRDNSKNGYLLEVALVYPEKIHEKIQKNIQNDSSMAPEKIKVTEDMLSPLQLEMKNRYVIKVGITQKLIPNLLSKKELYCSLQKFEILFSKGMEINKSTCNIRI